MCKATGYTAYAFKSQMELQELGQYKGNCPQKTVQTSVRFCKTIQPAKHNPIQSSLPERRYDTQDKLNFLPNAKDLKPVMVRLIRDFAEFQQLNSLHN